MNETEKRKAGRQPSPPREKTRQMAIRIEPSFDVMFDLIGDALSSECGLRFHRAQVAKAMLKAGFGVYAEKLGINPDDVETTLDERFGERTQ